MTQPNFQQSEGRNRPLDETTLLRFGLLAAGAFFIGFSIKVNIDTPVLRFSAGPILVILYGLLGMVLAGCAGLRKPPVWLRWVILIAVLLHLPTRALIWGSGVGVSTWTITDQGLYTDFAAEVLRRGLNPYAWDMSGAFSVYRAPLGMHTPRLDGSLVTSFPYPPLSILLAVPVQWAGLPAAVTLSVLAHTLALLMIFLAAPRQVQPLILLPPLIGIDVIYLSTVGSLDSLWIMLLVAMVIAWKKPTWRGVLFGLACAAKQSAWLIAPFLLIDLLRRDDPEGRPIRRAVVFTAISAGVFTIINLPFVIWGPADWLTGVLQPLTDDLVFFSQGALSTLSHLGLTTMPKEYYLLASVLVLMISLITHWRHYPALRHAMWLAPALFMWFSYRSTYPYWLSWILPLMAALVTDPPQYCQPRHPVNWQPTVAMAGAALTLIVGSGLAFSGRTSPVSVEVISPVRLNWGRIEELELRVTNHSTEVLTPRFAVQGMGASINPFPWQIDSGPEQLTPGAHGTYEISMARPLSIWMSYDAQVVVTDAGGDTNLRGIGVVRGNNGYAWPDAVINADYYYWEVDAAQPALWSVQPSENTEVTLDYVVVEGRSALQVTLAGDSHSTRQVVLRTTSLFPYEPLTLWAYPPSGYGGDMAYGIDFVDGARQYRITLGQELYAGRLDAPVVFHRDVPTDQWVPVVLDLSALYDQNGWDLPPFQTTFHRSVYYDLRVVYPGLVVSYTGPEEQVTVVFGPLEQESWGVPPRELMAETLENPADAYTRIGAWYERTRNFNMAAEAYQNALTYDASYGPAWAGLTRTQSYLETTSR